MDTVANIKVAADYFKSKQNAVLLPNRNFGSRKFIHLGLGAKSHSTGHLKDISRLSKDDGSDTAPTYTGFPEETMREGKGNLFSYTSNNFILSLP